MDVAPVNLPDLFANVASVLEVQRETLNQADTFNHNHGEHMVEIFQAAAQAAAEMKDAPIADAMQHAAGLLRQRSENGSAQVYARGLGLLAVQLRQRELTLDDLLLTVRDYLHESKEPEEETTKRSADVVKALLTALADWSQVETDLGQGAAAQPGGGLDMGYLFGVGMAYLQAKQKGGSRLEVLSETVCSASPLGKVPHRHLSGVIAIQALVEAMGRQSG